MNDIPAALGILGGTFNPPHNAHLALARAALASGHVDEVVLIPDSIPPHKNAPAVSAGHRLAMTMRLAAEDPRISVSTAELEREGPSFTIDTIRDLCTHMPNRPLRLIIGADMAVEFDQWRDAEEVAHLAPPLYAARPGWLLDSTKREALPPLAQRILAGDRIEMPAMAISSTTIRERIAKEEDVSAMLPARVLAYIREHELYR